MRLRQGCVMSPGLKNSVIKEVNQSRVGNGEAKSHEMVAK